MSLFVLLMPTGKNVTLDVKASDTLQQLKALIFAKEGVPTNKQTVLFAGKELTGLKKPLNHFSLKHHDLIYVFDRRPQDWTFVSLCCFVVSLDLLFLLCVIFLSCVVVCISP